MMTTPVFTLQQIDSAIRAGLSIAGRGYTLTPEEATQKGAAYRGNLAHYRNLAQKSLTEGDYLQSAEKSWGAYAQTIKSAGADYGMNVTTHRNLLSVAQELTSLVASADATTSARLRSGFLAARSLHQHFYENDLQAAEVETSVEEALAVIDLLQSLFHRDR